MSWRLLIEHRTHVSYDGAARASYNEARMTPVTLGGQTVLEARLWTDAQVPVWGYRDYWGTHVSAFDIQAPHDDLLVTARATVETSSPGAVAAPLSWPDLRARVEAGRLAEFGAPTSRTSVSAELGASARQRTAGLDPLAAAGEIASWVHGHVTYETGSQPGCRPARREALRPGPGRLPGHRPPDRGPAARDRAACKPGYRYPGYLFPVTGRRARGDCAHLRATSHAWIEYWAGQWAACDPTNNAVVGLRHVMVAAGRDYDDVPPLKGIYHGAPGSAMEVSVTLTRLA